MKYISAFDFYKLIDSDLIDKTISKIENENILFSKPSSKYDLVVNNRHYPPKEVMRLMAKIHGYKIDETTLAGGQVNKPFQKFGYSIIEKQKTMQFKDLILQYIQILKEKGEPDEYYKYTAIETFQQHWNLDAPDFNEMFRLAFAKKGNLLFQNSWGFIEKCAKHLPEETRQLFRQLYDETTALPLRIYQFQESAKNLVPQLKALLGNRTLNDQQDERSISVYLAFRYPENYMIYKNDFYQNTCELLQIPPEKTGRKYLHLLELAQNWISNGDLIPLENEGTYRNYYPKRTWNDQYLMIQNVLWVINRNNNKGENELVKFLDKFDYHHLVQYYTFLDEIITQFELQPDDDRYYFSKNDTHLIFTIGQRYVWNLTNQKKKDYFFRVIATQAFTPKFETFDGKTRAYLNHVLNFQEVTNQKKDIFQAIATELDRTDISSYRKNNQELYEKMAFDIEFRNHILTQLQKTNNMDLKTIFGKWLFENSTSSYHRNDYDFLIKRLDEYQQFFDYNIYECNQNNYKDLIKKISDFIYSNDETTDFFEYSKKQSNHIPRAILGKENYFKFLRMYFDGTSTSFETQTTIQPLNQILYGPPGTGKTYHTINKAISIIHPEFDLNQNRENIKQAYERLVKEGQIVFTTFHQSMSYEDFVEGIKPVNTDEQIKYEVKNGIFKELSIRASSNTKSNFEESYNNLIKEILENENDYLVLKTKSNKTFRVNVNSNNNLNLYTTDNINKQGTLTKEKLFKQVNGYSEFNGWEGYVNSVIKHLQDYHNLKINSNTTLENFVLIIDEINRGNISAIFGELITLIEDDKRKGNAEALEVVLPYSQEKFSVPNNLYIIGTMNTADRSVEALDTALRRRFHFEEMMPEYEKISKILFNGFNLGEVLKTINTRIEALLDRDHSIGHAYFFKIKSNDTTELLSVFKNKIIPLLQEYFYHDYEKIALILGEGFVEIIEPKQHKVQFAQWKNNYINQPESLVQFQLKSEIKDIEEAIQILLNQNV